MVLKISKRSILRFTDSCNGSTCRCARRNNTVQYVYGICVTWLINSLSMARSSYATPEFRSGRTSGDLKTFTSHVTYTSCDVDTLRATSSQRCHSCVTFVCWGWCGRFAALASMNRAAMREKRIYKNCRFSPPSSSHLSVMQFVYIFRGWRYVTERELHELHVTELRTIIFVSKTQRENNKYIVGFKKIFFLLSK